MKREKENHILIKEEGMGDQFFMWSIIVSTSI